MKKYTYKILNRKNVPTLSLKSNKERTLNIKLIIHITTNNIKLIMHIISKTITTKNIATTH